MKTIITIVALILIVLSMFWGYHSNNTVIVIETEIGDIEVELYLKEAPITAANFLRYVDSSAFVNSFFYRTVTKENQPNNDIKIEVIQGGLYEEDKMFTPIEHESTEKTGILHKNGVISMARNEPGTATSEFFICIGDQPELDFGGKRNPDGQGFAAFGKVINGIGVVKRIHNWPENKQMLDPKIKINNIYRDK
ncbi:MAG: peptidylprolyl isomerase [Bacteroidetes bacterium]|nr:peptidylprolyl isomerase [Bacteroidota bacterium]